MLVLVARVGGLSCRRPVASTRPELRVANRPPDEYEDRYMAAEGGVLHREKFKAPWYMHALLLLPGVAGVVGAALAKEPMVALAVAGVTGFVWTNFAAIRVVVSRQKVHIQFGLFGPQIPVEDIVDVKVGSTSLLRYGGKGIRFGLDGSVAYSMLGDEGTGVEIVYKNKRGRLKKVVVSARDAPALVAAIQEAQGGATSALAGARERVGLLEAPSGELVPAPELAAEPATEQGEAEREVEALLAAGGAAVEAEKG